MNKWVNVLYLYCESCATEIRRNSESTVVKPNPECKADLEGSEWDPARIFNSGSNIGYRNRCFTILGTGIAILSYRGLGIGFFLERGPSVDRWRVDTQMLTRKLSTV